MVCFLVVEVKMKEELKFFSTALNELNKFRGKHIAIIKNRVVASGLNAISVLEKARKSHPNEKPVLAFVPKEETLVLLVSKTTRHRRVA